MNLVILGPPGSGKGTQAEFLKEKFSLDHIDIGLHLRKVAAEDTKLGRMVNTHINKKKDLVPVEVVVEVLKKAVGLVSDEKGIVLDGMPRRMDQIQGVDDALAAHGRKVDQVVYLYVPEGVILERIQHRYRCGECHTYYILGRTIESDKICPKCGILVEQREDDTPDGVKTRLAIYHKNTLPVIDYYKKMNMLLEVGAGLESTSVFKEIAQTLEERGI